MLVLANLQLVNGHCEKLFGIIAQNQQIGNNYFPHYKIYVEWQKTGRLRGGSSV